MALNRRSAALRLQAMRPSDPRRRATYADLEKVPPEKVAELIDGVLHVNPRPASPHARAATRVGLLVGPFDRGGGTGSEDPPGPGGWIILLEPELHLGEDVLVPDWAGWRRQRMPEMPDTAAFTLAPDWVCEVLSESTAGVDRGEKLPIYARAGVRHLWLADPGARTLEVFRLDGDGWRLAGVHAADARIRAEPFDALELPLGALWER